MWWIYILVSCFFVLMLYGFWLRLILQVIRVDAENEFYQWLIRHTNVLIAPLNQLFGPLKVKQIEVFCLMVILILELVQGYVLVGLFYDIWFPFYKVPFLVIGDSLIYILNIFFFAMLFRVILGWTSSESVVPFRHVVNTLTLPFLRYSRELIPIMGGMDMAPLVWMIFFKVIAFIIFASLAIFLR